MKPGSLVEVITKQALPAAGAYISDNALPYINVEPRSRRLTFIIDQTRGAGASNAIRLRVEWDFQNMQGVRSTIVDETIDIATAPFAREALGLNEYSGPVIAAATQKWCFTVEVPGGADKVRLNAAEFGTTATPPTVQAWMIPVKDES